MRHSVDERENFVTPEGGHRRACVLHKSVLSVNGAIKVSFIWDPSCPYSKFGEDWLKMRALDIIDCTEFDAIRVLETHTPTHNIPCTRTGQTVSYVLSNTVSVQSFCRRPYNNFIVRCRIPNIRYHGNKGRSEVNFNRTIRFGDHDFLKRVGYFGDQKSFCCAILDEFIFLQNRKSLAHRINCLFPALPKKYCVSVT